MRPGSAATVRDDSLFATCLIPAPSPAPAPGLGRAPLILLHGFTGDVGTWAPLVSALGDWADFGRAVWAVDLVGHGKSPRPGAAAAHAIPAQAEAVAATLAERGVERAVWLGYSMGGRVALTRAARAPQSVAGLILVGVSPGIVEPRARVARAAADERLAAAIEQDGLAAFVDRWADLPIFASQARLGPPHAARMRRQRLRNDPDALAASLRHAGQGVMPPLFDALPGLRVPTLLVAGAMDEKYRALASDMADSLPDGEVSLVAGAGHAVQLEDPAALAGLVATWLARRAP